MAWREQRVYTVMALQIMKLILNDIFIALGKGR